MISNAPSTRETRISSWILAPATGAQGVGVGGAGTTGHGGLQHRGGPKSLRESLHHDTGSLNAMVQSGPQMLPLPPTLPTHRVTKCQSGPTHAVT